jgi:hypothetical protein
MNKNFWEKIIPLFFFSAEQIFLHNRFRCTIRGQQPRKKKKKELWWAARGIRRRRRWRRRSQSAKLPVLLRSIFWLKSVLLQASGRIGLSLCFVRCAGTFFSPSEMVEVWRSWRRGSEVESFACRRRCRYRIHLLPLLRCELCCSYCCSSSVVSSVILHQQGVNRCCNR